MSDPTTYGGVQVQGLTMEKLLRLLADTTAGHKHNATDSAAVGPLTTDLVVGTDSATAPHVELVYATPSVEVYSETSADDQFHARVGGSAAARVLLESAGGGDLASPTTKNNGGHLGRVSFGGYDGSSWSGEQAAVIGAATEEWDGSGHGTKLVFRITADNATATTDVVKVDANGLDLIDGDVFKVSGTQVVSARQTGWTAPTGTEDRGTFATSTVTLPELAERVHALIDDLTTHGLIGT